MSVNSASSSSRDSIAGSAPAARPAGPAGRPPGRSPEGPPRSPERPPRSPLDWAKQRLSSRGSRRLSAAGQRATNQLTHLGPSWRVVDWPAAVLPEAEQDQTGFLAIGPGGVYSVTVVDHGRQRVMLAGDVVQIQGRRPPYVARARRTAKRVSQKLSAAVGANVPVVPVLAFVGSGAFSAQGQPTGCLAVNHRELDRLLLAAGHKISAGTAQKLADVASHPSTWADQYRWYSADQTASDNRTAYR